MNELDRCNRLLEQLETQRTEMLSGVKSWEPQLVSLRPEPESWSAVEVFDHLAKSERGILNQTRKGLESPHILGTGARLAARLKVTALERALRSSHRFPVPPGARKSRPDADLMLSQVEERWDETRAELRQTVQALRSEELIGGVFRHPIAGWMTVSDVLKNLSAHLHHHTFQLSRISASFSKAPSASNNQASE